MGQINRFYIFCFNLSAIFVLKPRMSCNYELSRLFPFFPHHFCHFSKSGLSGFIETFDLVFCRLKTPANERTNPDGFVVLFLLLAFFGKPPMWRFVIRFAFLVCGKKHERRRKSVKYFNCSPSLYFSDFSRPSVSSYFSIVSPNL